jgi:nucleotide-binding universal stress UspA family protein
MPKVHTIMVAIDFSKYSQPTAEYAAQMAHDLDADLIFINVINQRDIDAAQSIMATYGTLQNDQFLTDRLRDRHEALDQLIQSCHAEASRTRGLVRMGLPYQKLLESIDEEKPDLLIMATKGRTDLADVVMGSCARAMYRRSPIPLLSIRGDKFFDR